MRKYIYLLLPFLFLLFPLSVNASNLPTIPGNFASSDLVTFLASCASYEMMNSQGFGINNDEVLTMSQLLNGRSVQDSFQVRTDTMTNANWIPALNWYDSQGNLLQPSQCNIAFIQSDIGNAMYIYDTVSGDVVLEGESFNTAVSTVIADIYGHILNSQWLNFKDNVSDNTLNSVFVAPQVSSELKQQYQSYAFSGYIRSINQNFILFIPNGASPNCRILPVNGYYTKEWSGGSSQPPFQGIDLQFFCNNWDCIVAQGSDTSWLLRSGPYSYSGVTYTYACGWYNSYNVLDSGGEVYYKAPTDAEYNAIISSSSSVIYGDPVTAGNNTPTYYNYTYVTENPPSITRTVNNNYEYNYPTTNNNYPTTNTYNVTNYNPTENSYIYNISQVSDTPQIGEDIGTLDPNEITDGLPILNNLSKRFPFSIPWDIYNILSSLSSERETPYIDTYVTIPAVNYTWHIQYDLSDFDDIASLFRKLFLISFIIGLAWFSYDHFFGE